MPMECNSFCEFWSKYRCSQCKSVNWIYCSHSERAYPNIPEACECWKCGHKFYLYDRYEFEARFGFELEEYGEEKVITDYMHFEKGLENPS